MRSVQDTLLISGQAKLYIIDATQIAVKAMARHDSALAAKGRELVGHDMGVSENRLNPEKPNGFADHYPY